MVAEVSRTRWIHGLAFLAVVAAAAGTVYRWPELAAGPATTLGTLGFFSTLYGLAFAILELGRTRTAAQFAAVEARNAHSAVSAVVTITEKDLPESFSYSGRGDEVASQKLWDCLSRISGYFAELEADTKRFTELNR